MLVISKSLFIVFAIDLPFNCNKYVFLKEPLFRACVFRAVPHLTDGIRLSGLKLFEL